ncbi:Oidioi.mRNA.OKI2018_I69.chr2.g5400.t1.cds [Oikopleura dioica]|uniref:Oidioi.mRNA.OKI2018_I69.chr2.g5400.t1.cds n=1 Tax=Oikopleura dioica TaxID=34765 RepID=A0ABN7T4L5_OIKDI|nr:Oidioi.mRNA.OKI2018_I69.chr2.g5400.t1.cds [Oikopleura dioica]
MSWKRKFAPKPEPPVAAAPFEPETSPMDSDFEGAGDGLLEEVITQDPPTRLYPVLDHEDETVVGPTDETVVVPPNESVAIPENGEMIIQNQTSLTKTFGLGAAFAAGAITASIFLCYLYRWAHQQQSPLAQSFAEEHELASITPLPEITEDELDPVEDIVVNMNELSLQESKEEAEDIQAPAQPSVATPQPNEEPALQVDEHSVSHPTPEMMQQILQDQVAQQLPPPAPISESTPLPVRPTRRSSRNAKARVFKGKYPK